jgi:hypothetical protein
MKNINQNSKVTATQFIEAFNTNDWETVRKVVTSNYMYSKNSPLGTRNIPLIESGFEFVCDFNGNKVFRKRKQSLELLLTPKWAGIICGGRGGMRLII